MARPGRAAHQRPGLLSASTRGKLELTLSEDEGQEDKVVDKLLGEAVKNVFESYFDPKHFRPLVEWFESGKSFVTGDRLASAGTMCNGSREAPLVRKELPHFLQRPELSASRGRRRRRRRPVRRSLFLKGCSENRLNKNVRGGETHYKR